MKRKIITTSLFAILTLFAFANQNDSIDTVHLSEVSVYSAKETNVRNAPVSATVMGEGKIIQSQITSVRDLSGKVPNFFIPDYGSAMSGAPYVRGIGSRNSSQSISLYVDNVPYIEKSAFDFELYDIERIEVLRGPQGTLYGRNAMSGHLSINTLSPLNYQGLKVSVTGGNHGFFLGKASYYTKFSDKLGLSIGGYYGQHNGFYFNDFKKENVDAEKSAGGRAKLVWDASKQFKLEYLADFDYIHQGAFPYGLYVDSTKTTQNPSFNDEGSYFRRRLNNALSIKHIYQDIVITASLSHQYFEDKMIMDQDYLPASIFTIEQGQKQHMFNGEAVVKSLATSNYKWLVGVNAYGQNLGVSAPVTFKEDGIKNIIQPQISGAMPPGMSVKITNPEIYIPGWFDNTRTGGAMFHQSTFDNLLVDGLSFTVGMRLDIEKVVLDYDSSAEIDVEMKMPSMPMPQTITRKAELKGSVDTTFVEVLPRAALKYEWNRNNFVYASVSRGYKTGGFNIQMISDLITQQFMGAPNPNAPAPDVKRGIMYKPEHSWNYEVGVSNSFLNNKLRTSATLYYMDISGLQLTEFVESGAGRKLTNAGASTSKGVELSAEMLLGGGFSLDLNYGYAHATFKHYKTVITVGKEDVEIDYKGKFVPYAPQHTANANLNYLKKFENSFISQVYCNLSYSGIGKIYWTDNNAISENFYSLLNAKVGAKKGIFGLELWGKNLLNSDYNAFYFESFGNSFFQKGKPIQFGARVTLDL